MKINEILAASMVADREMEKHLTLGLISKTEKLNTLGESGPEISLAHPIQMMYLCG